VKSISQGLPFPQELAGWLAESPIRLVDVGASGGLQPPWKDVASLLRVVGFEPDRKAWDTLRKLGVPANFTYVDKALGYRREALTLNVTKRPGGTSILRPDHFFLDQFDNSDAFEVVGTLECEASTLDAQLADLDIEAVDFVKLDTQGSELFVLEGAHETLRSGVLGLEVEVELNRVYVDQPLFGDVDAFLRDYGFELFDCAPHRWGRWSGRGLDALAGGQPIWADAVYLVGLPRFRELAAAVRDREALVAKMVAVCLLYGVVDYALEIVADAGESLAAEASTELAAAIRRFDGAAGRRDSVHNVSIAVTDARRMRKAAKRMGIPPEQQIAVALESWLTAQAHGPVQRTGDAVRSLAGPARRATRAVFRRARAG
jgi:FkbM family methyltransferase